MEEARVILRAVGEEASRTFVPEQADDYGKGLDEDAVRSAIDQAYAAYSQVVDGVIQEAGEKWHGDAVEEVTSEEALDGSWTKAGALFNRMARRVSEFNWSAVSGPEVSAPAVELKEYDSRVFEVVVRLARQIVRVGGGRELSLGNLSGNGEGSGGGASGALGTLIWGLFFDFGRRAAGGGGQSDPGSRRDRREPDHLCALRAGRAHGGGHDVEYRGRVVFRVPSASGRV